MLTIRSDTTRDILLPNNIDTALEIAGCLIAKKSPSYVFIMNGNEVLADRRAIAEYAIEQNRAYSWRVALA